MKIWTGEGRQGGNSGPRRRRPRGHQRGQAEDREKAGCLWEGTGEEAEGGQGWKPHKEGLYIGPGQVQEPREQASEAREVGPMDLLSPGS